MTSAFQRVRGLHAWRLSITLLHAWRLSITLLHAWRLSTTLLHAWRLSITLLHRQPHMSFRGFLSISGWWTLSCMAEDSPHVTMQRVTTCWCSPGVLAGGNAWWNSLSQGGPRTVNENKRVLPFKQLLRFHSPREFNYSCTFFPPNWSWGDVKVSKTGTNRFHGSHHAQSEKLA